MCNTLAASSNTANYVMDTNSYNIIYFIILIDYYSLVWYYKTQNSINVNITRQMDSRRYQKI